LSGSPELFCTRWALFDEAWRNPQEDCAATLHTNTMTSNHYLALLRGINVGGRNIIKMTDLKKCFEDLGCVDVATFIQSGNVVFRSEQADAGALVSKIERALSGHFAYSSRVVVLTRTQLAQVVKRAPAGFGEQPDEFKYDVIFLREPITETQAIRSISVREGVDAIYKGKGVVYCSRLISKLTQSHLSRIVSLPVYQHMTIRNWNTTIKLCALLGLSERPGSASAQQQIS
jgi:uncharacterized protein (DUF1697 family)